MTTIQEIKAAIEAIRGKMKIVASFKDDALFISGAGTQLRKDRALLDLALRALEKQDEALAVIGIEMPETIHTSEVELGQALAARKTRAEVLSILKNGSCDCGFGKQGHVGKHLAGCPAILKEVK